MEKFEKLSGVAAPMPLVNIDTDMIIPKVFLKTIKRSGLGVNLFDEMRYDVKLLRPAAQLHCTCICIHVR